MMPGTAAYAWLGYASRRAVTGETDAIGYGLAALAVLAAIVFVPRLVRRIKRSSSGWITVPELREQLSSGAALTLLDVRDPHEFVGPLGHIPGARNLPLAVLPRSVADIGGSGARSTVLVCRTDKRSANAADVLRGAAMRDVRVLRGGMETWNAAGAPVSRDGS
jgi:rhodanese-related sulfurtransferase